jgi:ketosteroid isomerase-like protein
MIRVAVLLGFSLSLFAASPADSVRKVLENQARDWNRGDIAAFMTGYENSPETTFVGTAVTKGYAAVLDRYKKKYQSKAEMGTLEFSAIEVRMLCRDSASVIGRFHLDRAKDAGGEASGIFSLVLHRSSAGWKIIIDHTAADPPKAN